MMLMLGFRRIPKILNDSKNFSRKNMKENGLIYWSFFRFNDQNLFLDGMLNQQKQWNKKWNPKPKLVSIKHPIQLQNHHQVSHIHRASPIRSNLHLILHQLHRTMLHVLVNSDFIHSVSHCDLFRTYVFHPFNHLNHLCWSSMLQYLLHQIPPLLDQHVSFMNTLDFSLSIFH